MNAGFVYSFVKSATFFLMTANLLVLALVGLLFLSSFDYRESGCYSVE